jgi:hypothetical protein
MKRGFWNSGGFGDSAKHLFVQETIRRNKLDCFAISQTGRPQFSVRFLTHLSAGYDFSWYCLPPLGRPGGVC